MRVKEVMSSKSRIVLSLIGFLLVAAAFLSVWCPTNCGSVPPPPHRQTENFFTSTEFFAKQVPGIPEPGTYKLEKIFKSPNFKVLDSKGLSQPLTNYTEKKYTLLTFFYQRCSDANGCPYATAVFHTVKNKLENYDLAKDIRLVNISFDPFRDTPMMMAGLEKQAQHNSTPGKSIEWSYLTTSSVDELLPLVEAFGQNVDVKKDSLTGDKSLTYQHVLKIFLIDKEGYIREIYTSAYLSPDILLNDIQTLLMSSGK